jgi:tetratricopeptide (TPR) repeat protein
MALALGEETGDERVIGYACGWLTYTCTDLGLLDEAVVLGERVQTMSIYKSDPELFRITSGGLGTAYWFKGEMRKLKATANAMIEYGKSHDKLTCLTAGYMLLGCSYLSSGDFASAIECEEKAVNTALEPQFVMNSKTALGMAYVADGQYQEASTILREVNKLIESCGYAWAGEPVQMLSAVVMITEGHIHQGIEMLEVLIESTLKSGGKYRYALMNYQLGRVYIQIAQGGGGKKDLSFLARNIGFLIKTFPFAHKKAEDHLTKAIQTTKEIGAKGLLAQAYLDRGRLRLSKGKTDEARKYITDAIQLFEECEADVFLKQAKEALASL